MEEQPRTQVPLFRPGWKIDPSRIGLFSENVVPLGLCVFFLIEEKLEDAYKRMRDNAMWDNAHPGEKRIRKN